MTKRILALLCALVMLFALAACGQPAEETTAAPEAAPDAAPEAVPEAGTDNAITLYYPMFYNTFDPANQSDYCYLMMYDSLFAIDFDSETNDFRSTYTDADSVTGQIAEGYEWDEATGTMVVTIRDGIFFQDGKQVGYSGRQLTASDVAYSYDRLLGADGVAKAESEIDWASTLACLAGASASASGEPSEEPTEEAEEEARVIVEADDEARTVTFHFAEGYWNDIAVTTFLTTPVNIVGPEWDELTADQQTDVDYVCGTGAWVLTEYVKDSYMVFEANPNYYMTDANGVQLPYLDKVTLQYIADSDQIAAQFIAGQIDWFGDRTNNVLNSSQLALVEASKDAADYVICRYATGSPAGIGFKLSQAEQPWSDPNVRLALQYAINGEAINAYRGIDELTFTGLWSDAVQSWRWDMDEETLASWTTYDVDYAKQLLADAGYPDGFDMKVVLDETQDQDLFELVKAQWAAIGVNVEYEIQGVMAAGAVITDPENPALYNVPGAGGFSDWGVVSFSVLNGGFSAGYFYDEPDFDQAAEDFQTAETAEDQAAAAQIMDEIFSTGHWCVALGGAPAQTQMISSRIQNYDGQYFYYNQRMRTVLANLSVE